MIKNKRFPILILLVSTLLLMCKNQEEYTMKSEIFAGNSYQNKLYSTWALFYSDSTTAKEQRKNLFRGSSSWSIQEEEEKLRLLSNDYLTANTFDVIDSISIKGSWINCGENSDKSLDTLIELKINCILGKIKKNNHVSWIVKRLETELKHIERIKVNINPQFYYAILNANNITSGLSVDMNVKQGKISRGNRLCQIDFKYDEPQKILNQELQRKIFVHTLIDTEKLGYRNAFERYEGDLFIENNNRILK